MLTRIALDGLALLVVPARAAPPIDAYGRLPSIEDAALSPDGTKVAYVRTTHEHRSVAIVSIDDATVIQVIRLGDQKLRSLSWADDEHVLMTIVSTSMQFELRGERTEWHLIAAFDLKNRKITGLLDHVHDGAKTMNVVYGRPVVRRTGKETLCVNLTTGAERLIKQGSDSTDEWLVNDAGEIVAEQDYVEFKRQWLIRLFRDGRAQQSVSGIAPIDQPDSGCPI